jgi:hypothetical protein
VEIGMADARGHHLDQHPPGVTAGTGTSSICNGWPKAWTTAAFIVFIGNLQDGVCRR